MEGFQKGTRWGEEKEQSEKTKDNEGWLQTAQTKNGAAVVVNFRVFFMCVGEGGERGSWSCILLQVSTNGLECSVSFIVLGTLPFCIILNAFEGEGVGRLKIRGTVV